MLAERAELVAELRLDDKMSAGLSRASRGLSNFSKNVGLSKKNLAALQTNLVRIGAVAAVGLGAAVTSGISSLAELEDANTETAAALKTSGLAAEVSAEQIRAWSNELETASKYAFDDKAIQRAANTLIRFGNVSEENLKAALQVSTDLGVRFGSVEEAASNLARAMADPTKATRALRSAGVSLTKAEQKKIAALVEGGKVAEAQAIILDKLRAKTEGAAAASQGKYRQALASLADAAEDAKMALGEAFLPVIEKVAAKLQTVLADPKAVASIREFGQTMARALDSLISIGEKLPWAQIGQSLQLAGAGAKAVLGAFTALPPWVQTAVLTGWGLNKLTGGAIGSVLGAVTKGVGEMIFDRFKGAIGITAGMVNVNGPVSGGGIPGATGGGAAGRLGSIASNVMKVAVVGMAAGVAVALAGEFANQSAQIRQQGADLNSAAKSFGNTADEKSIVNAINTIDEQFRNPLNAFALNMTDAFNGGKTALLQTRADLVASLATLKSATAAGDERTVARIGSLNAAVNRTTSVIASKNFSPRINVPVYVTNNVSVRQTETAVAVHHRYNPIVR